MNIQRGRGQVHAADEIKGYMPTPKCGGNRSVEGYHKTSGSVTCKNCLKILTAPAPVATPELPAGVTMDPATRVLSGTWRGMRDLYESGRATIVDGDLILR